ncbi:MAG: VOC family protein [Gemmatimonadota bacterium]|nr:MAG: VOC family protein [Gemmatimonadota bacterium]
MPARFAHVNVIAQDWRRLATFYERVFGCKPVPPQRDQRGDWLDRATGVPDAHIKGMHLRMPGGGHTLEVYEYSHMTDRPSIEANTPGFSHIAFVVDDLERASRDVLSNGGSAVGTIEQVHIATVGTLRFQYVADPEGNIIEIQEWSGNG